MRKVRDSNIELLRIVATLGVIILHINGHIGGVLQKVEILSIEGVVLYFLEIISAVAVNVFLLIFGYYQIEVSKARCVKVVHLITYVVAYRLILYITEVIIGFDSFSVFTLISRFIPLNYYVILYCVVYILSPYINCFLKYLPRKKIQIFVLTLFLLFSVEVYVVDLIEGITSYKLAGLSTIGIEGGQAGYTIVNFILVYIIGAYLKICEKEIEEKLSMRKIYRLQIASWCVLFGEIYLFTLYEVGGPVLDYSNPILILSSVTSFLIFKNNVIQENKIINELAKASFTVYLTHSIFINIFLKCLHTNSPIVIIECLLNSILTYLGGYVIYKTIGSLLDKICSFESKIFGLDRKG